MGLLERSKKRQNSEVLGFTAICRASRGGEGREEAKWPEGKVGAGQGWPVRKLLRRSERPLCYRRGSRREISLEKESHEGGSVSEVTV